MKITKVVLTGANGQMGQAMLKVLDNESDIEVVGAVDVNGGMPLNKVLGNDNPLKVEVSLAEVLANTQPDVLVDFTNARAAVENASEALKRGVRPVIGSTGLNTEQVSLLHSLCEENRCGALVAPNFALGAILMMRFAVECSKYFPDCEIVELHHDKKIDAPSGTAAATARMISESRTAANSPVEHREKTLGVRGGEIFGVPVHSIRLPGLVAHQEVIFGGEGETLTIRHDSLNRSSFGAGLVLAVRKVLNLDRMVIGLENLL
ncbi:4-hydroxy-tetrahydrodipicolinate reductase [Metallumcola ferriviriculae]|uniref:4-hydroxy-tetrahydrodipicolinate reductase n=1 Tax=Metallumcola ferriviriculae TaxID=3039180 RepID=A0AAU0UQ17_9FIRM|nr:4-hydroxy-tetrahydrodipicolinate reductase [Desulfitibacteraceae bacterium MK1]